MTLSSSLGRTLAQYLVDLPDDRPLLRLSHDVIRRDHVLGDRALGAHFEGARIALKTPDLTRALRSLAAVDGLADRVVFLSPTLGWDVAFDLVQEAGCDFILTDDLAGDGPVARYASLAYAVDHPASARPAPIQTQWVMTTSGTTGRPKLVGHSLASLSRSSKRDPNRGAGQRWGLVYDYTRFAGLQVVLQSVLSGAQLIVPGPDAPLETMLDLFAYHGCTHLSCTPTLWRKIVMTPGSGRLPLTQATLGGEIADDRILASVAGLYPNARVTHIFASTEAGVGFSVSDGAAGFPIGYLTDPPQGIALRVTDGQLYVKNPQVRPAYLGDQGSFADDTGWVKTGDAVQVTDSRVLFLGRDSGVINVGGNKVHPETVERVLLDHPHVSVAHVYAKSNPITGALVMADVVLADWDGDPKAASLAIVAHASASLDRHEVPSRVKIVDAIAVNAAGKVMRNQGAKP